MRKKERKFAINTYEHSYMIKVEYLTEGRNVTIKSETRFSVANI